MCIIMIEGNVFLPLLGLDYCVQGGLGEGKVTCPTLHDPRPAVHIAKALLFALTYPKIPCFIGSEEQQREKRVVSHCREN